MSLVGRNNTRAAKLTGEQVMELRRLYANGATQSYLCKLYGLSVGQVGRIVRGESWSTLPTVKSDAELSVATVHANHMAQHGPSEAEIIASQQRFMELQGKGSMSSPIGDEADDAGTGEGMAKLMRVARQELPPLPATAAQFKCAHCDQTFPSLLLQTAHEVEEHLT